MLEEQRKTEGRQAESPKRGHTDGDRQESAGQESPRLFSVRDRDARRIAVLGAGSWGTALALLLGANGHSVRIWARSSSLIASLQERRENREYLPDFPLPASVVPMFDLCEAMRDVDAVLFAVPSSGMREVAEAALPFLHPEALLISAAKGLEDGTGLRMSQVLGQVIPDSSARIVALSGPNLAIEIARGLPSASVAASVDIVAARSAQHLFSRQPAPTFRVYTGRDVIGVEMGGAIKNVIAIGAGVCDGLGFGDNSKAALMTRGLTEAIRLGIALGAHPDTFRGLSGAGDLIATGASRLSRNYRVGLALGQGRSLPEILEELGQVAEGVPTTHVLCELAASHRVEMPLSAALHSILFSGQSAPNVIRALMLRPPKDENEVL